MLSCLLSSGAPAPASRKPLSAGQQGHTEWTGSDQLQLDTAPPFSHWVGSLPGACVGRRIGDLKLIGSALAAKLRAELIASTDPISVAPLAKARGFFVAAPITVTERRQTITEHSATRQAQRALTATLRVSIRFAEQTSDLTTRRTWPAGHPEVVPSLINPAVKITGKRPTGRPGSCEPWTNREKWDTDTKAAERPTTQVPRSLAMMTSLSIAKGARY